METWSIGSHASSLGGATNSSHKSGGPVGMGIEREMSPAIRAGRTQTIALTSSAEASHAKTSALPASGPGSKESAADSSLSSCESLTLFDPGPSSLRTSRGSTALEALKAQTSGSSSTRWPSAGIWRHGELSTRNTSGCHSEGDECSCAPSLTEILEPNASEKYSLSQKAAAGILRRATRRGRSLPPQLEEALRAVAGPEETAP